MEITFRESYPPENTKLTIKPLFLNYGVLSVTLERTYDNSEDVEFLDFFMDADVLYKFIGVLHKQLKEINKYDKSMHHRFYSRDTDKDDRWCEICGKSEADHKD